MTLAVGPRSHVLSLEAYGPSIALYCLWDTDLLWQPYHFKLEKRTFIANEGMYTGQVRSHPYLNEFHKPGLTQS